MLSDVQPLFESYRLCTALFRNCLDGVDDALARRRLTSNTNNLHFLAVHLLDERFYMDLVMGGDYNPPFPELEDVSSVDEMPEDSPSIERVLELWNQVNPILESRFDGLTESDLSADSPFKFYPADAPQNVRLALAFLMHHEGYHIGQMALIRKGLGLPAMRYD